MVLQVVGELSASFIVSVKWSPRDVVCVYVVDRDVMCGMLHCEHLSEKLMFWKEALAFTMPEAWVLVNDTRHDCKAAILDVGLSMPDPGMVPDGAKCAKQHVSIRTAEIDD